MNFIAFDTETTGINAENDQIIELGAVRFENFEPVEEFNELINPGIAIPYDATVVNGISNEMVADKPPVQDILGPFADFCGETPLIAHNAPFDFKFMLAAIKSHSAKAPKGRVVDSYMLAKKVVPGLPNYKLATLLHHFNINAGTLHRACEDASCTGKMYALIIQSLERGGHPTDLDSLVELTGRKEMVFPQISQDQQLGLF